MLLSLSNLCKQCAGIPEIPSLGVIHLVYYFLQRVLIKNQLFVCKRGLIYYNKLFMRLVRFYFGEKA